jgi:hypothetical protein
MGSNKIKIVLSIVLALQLLSCLGKNEDYYIRKRAELTNKLNIPENVDKEMYINYGKFFAQPFSIHTCQQNEIISEFRKFAGDVKPVIIANWDIDGDGLKDYLIVEMLDRNMRIIKKGILINEEKKVYLMIDSNKGVYDDSKVYYETNRFDQAGTVAAFRLGFYEDEKGDSGLDYAFGRSKKFLETYSVNEKKIVSKIGLIPVDSQGNYVEIYIDSNNGRYHVPYNITLIMQKDSKYFSVGPILFGLEQFRQYHERMYNNYLVLSSKGVFVKSPILSECDKDLIDQIIDVEKHLKLYTKIYDEYNQYDQRIP